MVAGFVHGHAGGVDGFDCAHAVALDAGNLDESADGVAGHAEVVLHGDLGGMFDLRVGTVECGDETTGGHAAGYAYFALTADLGSGDAGVFFVQDADGGSGEEVADEAGFFGCVGAFNETHVVVGDGGNNSGGSVGRSGNDSASGGVLLVDGHGVYRDPVHGGERIFRAFGFEAAGETGGSAANVKASGEDAFDLDAALGAGLHGPPESEDAGFDSFFWRLRLPWMRRPIFCGWRSFGTVDGDCGVVEKSYFVVEDELRDGEVVVLCGREEVGGAAEGIRNGALADCAFGGALCFGDDEASADGVEDLFGKNGVGFVEGCEAHAIGVRDDAGGWIHLVAVEEKMSGLEEGNGFAAQKVECAGGADGGEFCFDLRWVYRVGGFAQKTEEDGAIGAVADSCEGE